ncbi:MAG: glycosyltransferase family 2 protein [Melioribacteraceae bacterium]|nr:glycosyltransferase family 2 protein [Melioribacteraceae bacterium]MCF8263244.1 glycosyltransferase family 2 protein [Melioribacteraceae bacterium]MCF8412218.1 glycosyltransferase family 2 protein [Melioribacteraceae bacterium]MCF8432307.1 glycosyltransferase family 2 protein [Melioribacteraceae bacterium]
MFLDELVLVIYIFSLSVLLLFGCHGFVMLYYRNKYAQNLPTESDVIEDYKKVTIQLPLYNELYVADRLVNAVCEIDYPKENLEIQVLDDSTDETVDIVARIVAEKQKEGFDIKHVRRTNRKGYKAGALKEGLEYATGDYIAIFDADFIPKTDFLKKTLRYFKDDQVGMVQTRWEHLNEDFSILTKIQALALDGHFVIEQTVRNRAGFFINFNGTGGVWKKSAIEDAGNWHDDTITEDLDLSYRAQLKGWKFIFLRDFTTPAELPSEINALKAQQFRWTKGAIETAKKLLPMVWSSKISLRIKMQSTFHLTNNIVFPFILLAGILNVPLIFIKNAGPYDNFFNFMSIFVLAFISSFLFYLYGQKEIYPNWRKKIVLFPVFMAGSMGLAVNNSRAVVEGLMNKKSEFVRTPKYKVVNKNDSFSDNKYIAKKVEKSAFVELLLAIYCSIGVIASIYFGEISALPFNLMFFFGFASISFMSFKQSSIK